MNKSTQVSNAAVPPKSSPSSPSNNDMEGAELRNNAVKLDQSGSKTSTDTGGEESKSATSEHEPFSPEVSEGVIDFTVPSSKKSGTSEANSTADESSPSTNREANTPLTPKEFEAAWMANWRTLAATNPEMNQKDSPLVKEMHDFLNSKDAGLKRFLCSTPRGPHYALHLAQMSLQAKKAHQFSKENADLKMRVKERDRKLSPSTGLPTANLQRKGFDQMNSAEQGSYLRRRAMEEDGLV